jgi:hypothetical protein
MNPLQEIAAKIAEHFPKMSDEQFKKSSTEVLAVYTLARLLGQGMGAIAAAAQYILVEMLAIKKFVGMPLESASARPTPRPPAPKSEVEQAVADGDWVMSGLRENDNTPSPAARANGNARSDADWVMEGIEDGAAPGPVPMVGAPVPPTNGGANVIPNPSSPPVPKEIQDILAAQAKASAASTMPAAPPMPPPPQVQIQPKPAQPQK